MFRVVGGGLDFEPGWDSLSSDGPDDGGPAMLCDCVLASGSEDKWVVLDDMVLLSVDPEGGHGLGCFWAIKSIELL